MTTTDEKRAALPTQDELRRVCESLGLRSRWAWRTGEPEPAWDDGLDAKQIGSKPTAAAVLIELLPPIHESEKWAVRAMERAAARGLQCSVSTVVGGGFHVMTLREDTAEFNTGDDMKMPAAVFAALLAAVDAGAIGGAE